MLRERLGDFEYFTEILLIITFVVIGGGALFLMASVPIPSTSFAFFSPSQTITPAIIALATDTPVAVLASPTRAFTETQNPTVTPTNTQSTVPTVTPQPSKTPLLPTATATPLQIPCEQPGWFPSNLELKDHHIFWYDGYYYLVATHAQWQVHRFAYARSTDLCTWEELPPILQKVELDEWDGMDIWAPFVLERDGVFYMFYTGVTWNHTQRIMLAVTLTPDVADSWVSMGAIFRPNFDGMKWNPGEWADCRDPSILEVDGVYYLYYTASQWDGGVIGLAKATSLLGPWENHGVTLGPVSGAELESPLVIERAGKYYLLYNHTHQAEYYRVSNSPTGSWSEPYLFTPGWAHEIWQTQDGSWYTSYLTGYQVTISPVAWASGKDVDYDLVKIEKGVGKE